MQDLIPLEGCDPELTSQAYCEGKCYYLSLEGSLDIPSLRAEMTLIDSSMLTTAIRR
jgi:hypothetical protein